MASSTASKTPFTDFAKKILEKAQFLDDYIAKNNIPVPSFEENGPPGLPPVPEVDLARMDILDNIEDLKLLTAGPAAQFTLLHVPGYHDYGVLSAVNQFDFWEAVPLGGTATIEEISKKTGLSQRLVKRFLRILTSKRIFAETEPNSGIIKHTATSALVTKVPLWKNWIGHCLEEVAPASLALGHTLKTVGESEEPQNAAIAQLNFKDHPEWKSAWDWWDNDGEGDQKGWRVKRFSGAMKVLTDDPSLRLDLIHELFDWDALGDAQMVDIGGSRGHISFEILKHHPKLKSIVQDLPLVERDWDPPADLASRASFQVHDFFTPQDVKGAEVYFLKHIIHDWSDKYATKILSNIIPAMTEKSRILIMDFVIPPAGVVPNTVMRMLAGIDIQMLACCPSMERTPEDWHALVQKTSPKLKLKEIHTVPGTSLGLVEIVLA